MKAVRPRMSAEDVRAVQERRRSSATRWSRKSNRSAARRRAIAESRG